MLSGFPEVSHLLPDGSEARGDVRRIQDAKNALVAGSGVQWPQGQAASPLRAEGTSHYCLLPRTCFDKSQCGPPWRSPLLPLLPSASLL